jgi:hypothetical protein
MPGSSPAGQQGSNSTLNPTPNAVFSLVVLLGYATIGLAVTLPRPANPTGCRGGAHNGRQVSVVSYADL